MLKPISAANMSLVDVAEKLPTLKRRQGLTSWRVFDKHMNEVEAYSAAEHGSKTKGKLNGPLETCWPNGREKDLELHKW